MRFAVYCFGSLLLTVSVAAYAYVTRVQFYPAVIYLVTSKFCIMVMGNMALVLTLLVGRVTKKIFLGTLRDAEVEILYENSRYAITETCLALTIFREELNMRVAALFAALLFAKIFHWLCQSRVEHLEQQESVSALTYSRILVLMSGLMGLDVSFVAVAAYMTLKTGPSVLLLFGFEFLVLAVTCISIFMRFMLHLIEQRIDGNWESKDSYLFTIELFTEILRLSVYLIFFGIIFTYYGIPLHIVRDLWISLKKLRKRLETYIKYRRIMQRIHQIFPDATQEEITETSQCIICREELDISQKIKKLPCGHVFHLDCMRRWLQQQQACPTCRAPILLDGAQRPADRLANADALQRRLVAQQAAAAAAAEAAEAGGAVVGADGGAGAGAGSAGGNSERAVGAAGSNPAAAAAGAAALARTTQPRAAASPAVATPAAATAPLPGSPVAVPAAMAGVSRSPAQAPAVMPLPSPSPLMSPLRSPMPVPAAASGASPATSPFVGGLPGFPSPLPSMASPLPSFTPFPLSPGMPGLGQASPSGGMPAFPMPMPMQMNPFGSPMSPMLPMTPGFGLGATPLTPEQQVEVIEKQIDSLQKLLEQVESSPAGSPLVDASRSRPQMQRQSSAAETELRRRRLQRFNSPPLQ
jgi:E3 ubiquitin-protein ligase synoviolin